MQRNVCGSEVQRAAFDGEILLGIDCVIDGGIDAQRQLTDGEGDFAFLCGGRAGLDAVFAVGVECQRPGAAEGDGRAVLAFDDGIFGDFVAGIRFIIVRGGVGQDIFRSVCGDDDDFARFVAGDRRSVGACQAQTAQDQPHTGCALLNFN